MIRSFISATRNSWSGIVFAFRSEQHFREEVCVLAASVPVALFLTDQGWLRIALIGTIILLLTVELLNTAIEKLCDHVHLDHHLVIKAVKDMGSAAVLGALTLTALVWGLAVWQAIFG